LLVLVELVEVEWGLFVPPAPFGPKVVVVVVVVTVDVPCWLGLAFVFTGRLELPWNDCVLVLVLVLVSQPLRFGAATAGWRARAAENASAETAASVLVMTYSHEGTLRTECHRPPQRDRSSR
jgi:hypothetical protein